MNMRYPGISQVVDRFCEPPESKLIQKRAGTCFTWILNILLFCSVTFLASMIAVNGVAVLYCIDHAAAGAAESESSALLPFVDPSFGPLSTFT